MNGAAAKRRRIRGQAAPRGLERFDRSPNLCHADERPQPTWRRGMSVESHLAELERRHEALKREIQEVQTHPGFDDMEVAALKRRKLQLKDEIAKLRHDQETMH
jgi:hypothetical protein